MQKVSLQQQAVELIKQLSTEKLKAVVDYLNYLQDKEAWEATHELSSDPEIAKSLEHEKADVKAGRLKRWEDVRRDIDHTKAIELNPNDAIAYNNRGGTYYLKGEYESAIADFSKAIELNPDYANAYNNRGVAHHLKEEYESAIVDFSKAIELKPDYAIAYNNRGRAYSEKGEVDSLTIRPDSPSAKLAVLQAIKDYNPAIGLNPKLAPAYYNRGVAWLRLREWDRAKSDLTVARDMGLDIITTFHDDYESVEEFEGRNGVQLPKDIAAMLL